MSFHELDPSFLLTAGSVIAGFALLTWGLAAKSQKRRKAGRLLIRQIPFEVVTDVYGRVTYSHLEFRERGIVAEAFYPWSRLKRYDWIGERPTRLKVVFQDTTHVYPLRYESDRESIEKVLESRTNRAA